jgi:hypothetical protein
MIRNAALAAMLSLLFVCGSAGAAGALVCPVPSAGANAAEKQAIAAALPAGHALDDAAKLDAAVTALRARGVSNASVVDGLIASYCPTVARDTGLSDQEKRTLVRRFAARIVQLVYALDSAEAVILDVPFRPDVMAQINARAAAERVSPEAWVADAIGRELKQSR